MMEWIAFFNLYNKSQPEHQTKRGEIDSFRTISCEFENETGYQVPKVLQVLLNVDSKPTLISKFGIVCQNPH